MRIEQVVEPIGAFGRPAAADSRDELPLGGGELHVEAVRANGRDLRRIGFGEVLGGDGDRSAAEEGDEAKSHGDGQGVNG